MLDISTVSAEERLEQDLADSYASSHLHECAAQRQTSSHIAAIAQQWERCLQNTGVDPVARAPQRD